MDDEPKIYVKPEYRTGDAYRSVDEATDQYYKDADIRGDSAFNKEFAAEKRNPPESWIITYYYYDVLEQPNTATDQDINGLSFIKYISEKITKACKDNYEDDIENLLQLHTAEHINCCVDRGNHDWNVDELCQSIINAGERSKEEGYARYDEVIHILLDNEEHRIIVGW